MNTPAHLILGAALMARPAPRRTLPAALAGGLAPDLSLYLMAGVALGILGIPAERVFDELYFSDAWQAVFAVDNSIFVWGALLAVALWRRGPGLLAFAGAGLLHIACDLPLHAGDGRPHFWPLTDWVFDSPLSYWDTRRGAAVLGPLEAGLAVAATVLLWRRFTGWGIRAGLALLLLAELWVVRGWFHFIA